jgi:hypothetical protein
MGWSILPYDMEELIISKLSLLESACIAATCRTFEDVFRGQMVLQQKAYRNLAAERFGQGRVAGIAAIADRFVKGECVHPNLVKVEPIACWITADGTLHVSGPSISPVEKAVEDIAAFITLADHLITTFVQAPNGSEVYFTVWRDRNDVTIAVYPWGDQDLEGVALAQALVSGPLAQSLCDREPSFDIQVRGSAGSRCTSAGLQAQIWPLLGLASQRTSHAPIVVGERDSLGKHGQLGRAGSVRNKGVALEVDSFVY